MWYQLEKSSRKCDPATCCCCMGAQSCFLWKTMERSFVIILRRFSVLKSFYLDFYSAEENFSRSQSAFAIKAMNQFKCKNSVPTHSMESTPTSVVWRKILFPLELIFDSCNNIMMKSGRNMRKSHCKGKIKFIIYDYYYLPFGWLECDGISPLSRKTASGPRPYQIQIILKKSIFPSPQWPN